VRDHVATERLSKLTLRVAASASQQKSWWRYWKGSHHVYMFAARCRWDVPEGDENALGLGLKGSEGGILGVVRTGPI
jgi:hypothetical protein